MILILNSDGFKQAMVLIAQPKNLVYLDVATLDFREGANVQNGSLAILLFEQHGTFGRPVDTVS